MGDPGPTPRWRFSDPEASGGLRLPPEVREATVPGPGRDGRARSIRTNSRLVLARTSRVHAGAKPKSPTLQGRRSGGVSALQGFESPSLRLPRSAPGPGTAPPIHFVAHQGGATCRVRAVPAGPTLKGGDPRTYRQSGHGSQIPRGGGTLLAQNLRDAHYVRVVYGSPSHLGERFAQVGTEALAEARLFLTRKGEFTSGRKACRQQ